MYGPAAADTSHSGTIFDQSGLPGCGGFTAYFLAAWPRTTLAFLHLKTVNQNASSEAELLNGFDVDYILSYVKPPQPDNPVGDSQLFIHTGRSFFFLFLFLSATRTHGRGMGNKTFRPQDVSPLVVFPLVVSPLFSTLVVSPHIP